MNEKSPLLANDNIYSATDYGVEGNEQSDVQQNQASYVTIPPIGPDELPPPYSPSQHGGTPMVSCRVCGFMIDISGKRDQHVVKCSNCNEATPIKNAPPGKKYARCPCNCLLICKSTSQRIACPRPNCKRIINFEPSQSAAEAQVPGMCQVSCAHCHNLFLFNTLNSALARCPHCRKVSSVGQQFSKRRSIICAFLAFLALTIAVGVIAGTYEMAKVHGGLYVIPIVFFILTVIFFVRFIYYCTMKVSLIEGMM